MAKGRRIIMKRYQVIIYAVASFQIILVIFIIFFSVEAFKTRSQIDKNIENYEMYRNNVVGASDMLPTYDNINMPNSKFAYKRVYKKWNENFGIYEDVGICLFIQYDELKYVDTKNNITSNYKFITDPETISEKSDNKMSNETYYYVFPLSNFTYRGYEFKICPNEYYWSLKHSSESFLMVGFDDLNYKICYLYFYSYSYDYICSFNTTLEQREKAMLNIIKKYFYWYD